MSPQTFILFGRSGAGKGTQAALLCDYLRKTDPGRGVIYIETGAKFREFMTGSSHTSRLTKAVLDKGGLLPEFLPIWLWTDILVRDFTGAEHLVLDGLSRRQNEAPILAGALAFYGRPRPFVVVLEVSRRWAEEHLMSRGRKDDTIEQVRRRLDWFDQNVLPTIEFFKKRADYTVVEVNGEQAAPKVHEDIIKACFGSLSGITASAG